MLNPSTWFGPPDPPEDQRPLKPERKNFSEPKPLKPKIIDFVQFSASAQVAFFTAGEGPELALRIERHTKGRGEPDVVEFFETGTGSAVIGRREEDVDGDGDVDIISVFDGGKLVRREIYDPAVAVTK